MNPVYPLEIASHFEYWQHRSSPDKGRLGGVGVSTKTKPPLTPPCQGENSIAKLFEGWNSIRGFK
jgi:hypothetical protein